MPVRTRDKACPECGFCGPVTYLTIHNPNTNNSLAITQYQLHQMADQGRATKIDDDTRVEVPVSNHQLDKLLEILL